MSEHKCECCPALGVVTDDQGVWFCQACYDQWQRDEIVADIRVLEKVRREWESEAQKRFAVALQVIYMKRDKAKPMDDRRLREFVFMDCLMYEVGDYAEAAEEAGKEVDHAP